MQSKKSEPPWNPRAMPVMMIGYAARLLMRLNDQRLRPLGFGTAQLPVVRALKDGVSLSQKELAAIAQIEQPSMAQMLARMERDGLIHRSPDPNDGRSSLISLTERANAQLPAGRRALSQVNDEALEGFSEAEKKQFVELLGRLIGNLQPQPGIDEEAAGRNSK